VRSYPIGNSNPVRRRSAPVRLGEPLARRRTRWCRDFMLASSGWMQVLDSTNPVHLGTHLCGFDAQDPGHKERMQRILMETQAEMDKVCAGPQSPSAFLSIGSSV
jgi:hypothetical protein